MSDKTKKYQIILADPPWDFKNKKTGGSMKSGASQKYLTTGNNWLENMDVNSIADDNCLLAMWWVGAMPQEAINLISAWGFRLVNMNGIVWNKLTETNKPFFGMGFYTRAGSESVAIAVKGSPKISDRGVRAVFKAEAQIQFESKVMQHSKKPTHVRDMLVQLCGDVPRLEMFARESAQGWDVFGNEAPNSIEIPSKKEPS